MKKKCLAIILIFILFISIGTCYAKPSISPSEESQVITETKNGLIKYDKKTIDKENLAIDAKACILIDSKTGVVLYEKNADTPHLYPASTTKMMTAIVAIENSKPDQIMTASQKAIDDIGEGGMNIGINPGEVMAMEQLLKPLLISSANEAANILSENVFNNKSEFIEKMNQKAKEIGAVNTHFVNPNGMHDDNHYTTARDLSTIAFYAMKLPLFKETVAKTEYQLDVTNKHSKWPILGTSNKLMYRKSKFFTKITGIKTGYTTQAGHNLVASAINNDGTELIAVVMGVYGVNSKVRVEDYCQRLLEYGLANYKEQTIVESNQIIKNNIPVKDAKDSLTVNAVTAQPISSILPLYDNESWRLSREEHVDTQLTAPIKKGQILGYIEYKKDGVSLGKTDVIASNDVELSSKAKFNKDLNNFIKNSILFKLIIAVLILALLLVILRLVLRRVSKNKRRRYKKY